MREKIPSQHPWSSGDMALIGCLAQATTLSPNAYYPDGGFSGVSRARVVPLLTEPQRVHEVLAFFENRRFHSLCHSAAVFSMSYCTPPLPLNSSHDGHV